jgi:hypothetical protein
MDLRPMHQDNFLEDVEIAEKVFGECPVSEFPRSQGG